MSLLQDVLRSHVPDSATLEKRLNNVVNKAAQGSSSDESDDELVNVVSLTARHPRPHTPPVAYAQRRRCPPHPRALTHLIAPRSPQGPADEISQRIFAKLSLKDLAKCALVSKKWSRSQTINYVWFQHYRNENFHDDTLPAGKWTKRESKQNWASALRPLIDACHSASCTCRTWGGPRPETPRELKEEKWRQEAETTTPGKIEMRGMYKELGGRKSPRQGWWSGDADF
ncbi:hypothetical protein B0H13DRAFT_2229954 [Mycena leptocephala]|nr:hypothetical protein B0H13DRAFT_2229954 [Mycena leptocephala]